MKINFQLINYLFISFLLIEGKWKVTIYHNSIISNYIWRPAVLMHGIKA